MNIDRRGFSKLAGAAALAPFAALAAGVARAEETLAQARARSQAAHEALAKREGLKMMGEETIAMLLYPGFTALDLVGPQYIFASMMGAKVQLVAKDPKLKPVMSDTGLAIQPDAGFAEVPEAPTILFVPGAAGGLIDALRDAETIAFLKDRGARTDYVTSVCTGSLLLGMAGLLEGRRATSHWVTHGLLSEFGATPVKARVVTDDRVITGGGVTAGLDFGLALLAALRGADYARAIQLQAEYAPEPPFDAGTPETAGPFLAESLDGIFAPLVAQARQAAAERRG